MRWRSTIGELLVPPTGLVPTPKLTSPVRQSHQIGQLEDEPTTQDQGMLAALSTGPCVVNLGVYSNRSPKSLG